MNLAVIIGVLSRRPEARSLPSGDVLVQYEVTTRLPSGPAESVPVVWLDPPARLPALEAGDEVVVVGRVRRRFYRAGGSTASRTEVVAERVVPARQHRRVDGLLERAQEAVAAHAQGPRGDLEG